MCAGNLRRCQCQAGAGGGGGEASEPCCEHPTSGDRRKERRVLPGRGNGQGGDAPASGLRCRQSMTQSPLIPPAHSQREARWVTTHIKDTIYRKSKAHHQRQQEPREPRPQRGVLGVALPLPVLAPGARDIKIKTMDEHQSSADYPRWADKV